MGTSGMSALMGSVNLSREPTSKQPDEIILAAFQDIGQILTEARIEQNLSIAQVAAKIHIRQRYLIDLEEGQISDLPGRVYILGFVRTYARLLDLDGEELIRRLRALPNLPAHERNKIPVPMPSEDEPNSLVLVASAALILLIAVGGYFFLKPTTKVSLPIINETVMDDSKAPSMEEAASNAVAEEEASEARPPALPGGAPSQMPSSDKPSTEALAQPVAQEATPGSLLPKKITLKAKEPSWIEIRDEAGRVMFMKVLKSGEEYVVPEKPGVTINTGNAGGIDIFVGDTKLPSLGARGDVKRGIRLETLQ